MREVHPGRWAALRQQAAPVVAAGEAVRRSLVVEAPRELQQVEAERHLRWVGRARVAVAAGVAEA